MADVEGLSGRLLIDGREVAGAGQSFSAIDPSTGSTLGPVFADADGAQVDLACKAAWAAFARYRQSGLPERAEFLERIAANIDQLGDVLVERAVLETALSPDRIRGECARTSGQLRMFADVVRAGRWLGLRVDDGDATPGQLPRPDLRQRRIPLGPVAVFAASNFPLAFSVAGGDTASALAAGAPVIVKAHPCHPGTSELVGRAVAEAVDALGLPTGTFGLLQGADYRVGVDLVQNPAVRAVGFTGSRSGGMALAAAAAQRPEPIPVFAEMSSVNPVCLLPAAVEQDPDRLADELVASMTNSAGQMCTNPGIILAVSGPATERVLARASDAISASVPSTMLSPAIAQAFRSAVAERSALSGVECRAHGKAGDQAGPTTASAHLHVTDMSTFSEHPRLQDEAFGPATLVVLLSSPEEFADVIDSLEGQLAICVHAVEDDYSLARQIFESAELKAGRLVFGGWPTGVTVGHAVIHGGPYPATTDSRFTSVGSAAIDRFLRPIAYQGFPDELLPAELRDQPAEPLPRLNNGG